MKIERIAMHHITMPLASPFETSFGRQYDRESIIVAMYGERMVGWGECVATNDPGYSYETAVTAWTNVINDTFESGIGGTAVDLDGATNGEYFWATSTYTAGAGTTSAWATGGGAQGSALTAGTDNYPPNAESALTYGPVDLSSYAIAQLSYDYWTETEAATDLLQVRISTDGTNFSLLSSFDGSSSGWQASGA